VECFGLQPDFGRSCGLRVDLTMKLPGLSFLDWLIVQCIASLHGWRSCAMALWGEVVVNIAPAHWRQSPSCLTRRRSCRNVVPS